MTEAEAECLAIEEEEAEADNWMTPVIQYLTNNTCKADQEKAMKQQCARYTMINEDLYRRGYSTPAKVHHQQTGRVHSGRDP